MPLMSQNTPEDKPITKTRRPSRIREAHEVKIIEAAEHIFAQRGFNGATLESIAEQQACPSRIWCIIFPRKSCSIRQY